MAYGALDMDSNPPATMTSLTPSWMFWVANMIALRPDAQTLLMVVASEELGILQVSSGSVSIGSILQ
jgi:hypothetical protein